MRSMVRFKKERKILDIKVENVNKDLDGIQKRVTSPLFADKAPGAMIEKKNASVVELEAQLSIRTPRLERIEKWPVATRPCRGLKNATTQYK